MRPLSLIILLLALASCKSAVEETADKAPLPEDDSVLLRVGSMEVTRADLDLQLNDKHNGRSDEATRQTALDELTNLARYRQAAHDAGLDDDPVTRAEISRILSNRLREEVLFPRLKAAAETIPEARLRELYESQSDRFKSAEKRQVAVLWLNPGADPERVANYQEKLKQARDWFFNESNLTENSGQGFSVLSVDYSEHAATRYKNGILGWIDARGGSSDWTRAVSEIAYSIDEVGGVSPVVTRPEGIFLVRTMAIKPAQQSSFESVKSSLESEEKARRRQQVETEFKQELEKKYPIDSK